MGNLYIIITFLLVLLIPFSSTSSFAAPSSNIEIYVKPMWQGDGYGAYACASGDTACEEAAAKAIPQRSMANLGCAITSMAMLYYGYGMRWMPYMNDPLLWDVPDISKPLNPGRLNRWAATKDPYGIPFGYNISGNSAELNWVKTTSNFIYLEPYTLRYWHGVFLKGVTGMSAPTAYTLLDKDLNNYTPPIMQISWTDRRPIFANPPKPAKFHSSHFIVVGGYDKEKDSYRAYNPSIRSSVNEKGIPQALSKQYDGVNMVLNEMKKLYRFNAYYLNKLDFSYLTLFMHSPIEVQVIDSEGRKTGYDSETGMALNEHPRAFYYDQESVSAAEGEDDPNGHHYKELAIVQPAEGNYIFKIFGTGDGPYRIDMEGRKSDKTVNLHTSITGTATPTLLETYRISYSPTGEASLSQTNQAPVANAGESQTGEQSYEITLDGSSSSDADGDPLKYAWSITSKPEDSIAGLSAATAVNPTFIPDKVGTYVLRLVVNDYFIDSAPSTVTITATPVISRISVVPNFSQSLSEGANAISFDVNNIGRVGVSSGSINVSLADPDGVVVYSGNQAFSISVGEAKTVSVPLTIPSLKFGNYTLIYSQSDETRTASASTVTIPNSVLTTFSFDKNSYRVRETANVTVNLTNTGKFNLDQMSVMLSVPDAGYSETKTVPLGVSSNPITLMYSITLPGSMTAGQHVLNVKTQLPYGSSIDQATKFAIPESSLLLRYAGPGTIYGEDNINLTIENAGGADTTYKSDKLTITDSMGILLYEGQITGTVLSGELKNVTDIRLPVQTATGSALLNVVLRDENTGAVTSLKASPAVIGVSAALSAVTDKDIYLNTEAVSAVSRLETNSFNIENGTLEVDVIKYKEPVSGLMQYLPKTGWWPFQQPTYLAIGSDGFVYVVETDNHRVLAFDRNGKMITTWGGYGAANGQFKSPYGIAVAPDGPFLWLIGVIIVFKNLTGMESLLQHGGYIGLVV